MASDLPWKLAQSIRDECYTSRNMEAPDCKVHDVAFQIREMEKE